MVYTCIITIGDKTAETILGNVWTNFAAFTKQAKAFLRVTFLPLAVCSRLCPSTLLAWLSSSCDALNLCLHNPDTYKYNSINDVLSVILKKIRLNLEN